MDSIIRDGVVWDPINHELYGLATIVMMMRSISNQSIIPIVMKYMIICYAYVWFFACLTCLFVFLNIFRRLNIRMYSLERVWIYVLLIRDLINWLWYMHVLCVLKRMEVKYNQRCMSGLDNAPCQMFSSAATTSAAVTVCLPIFSLYSVVICLLCYSPGAPCTVSRNHRHAPGRKAGSSACWCWSCCLCFCFCLKEVQLCLVIINRCVWFKFLSFDPWASVFAFYND
jgi:hypothetical protein